MTGTCIKKKQTLILKSPQMLKRGAHLTRRWPHTFHKSEQPCCQSATTSPCWASIRRSNARSTFKLFGKKDQTQFLYCAHCGADTSDCSCHGTNSDKTTDEIFEEHLQNFNSQQVNATRLHKDINNYLRCIKGKRFMLNNNAKYMVLILFLCYRPTCPLQNLSFSYRWA